VRLASRLLLVMLFAGGMVVPAAAQGHWSVFAGGGAAGFGGASTSAQDEAGETAQIKPSPTTRFHMGAARSFGRAGAVFGLAYSKSGLGGYGDGGSYSLSPALTLYDLRLLFSYRVAGLDHSSLIVALGPMLQVWSGDAILDTQARLGGVAALTLAVPISGSIGLLVTGSLGVAGSPFDAVLLESAGGFETANVWTRELGVGVRLSL
jgi:hypothetical protein